MSDTVYRVICPDGSGYMMTTDHKATLDKEWLDRWHDECRGIGPHIIQTAVFQDVEVSA